MSQSIDMNNVLLVAGREIRQILKMKSFWLTLLILPVAFALGHWWWEPTPGEVELSALRAAEPEKRGLNHPKQLCSPTKKHFGLGVLARTQRMCCRHLPCGRGGPSQRV